MNWFIALYLMWQPPLHHHGVPECLIKSIEYYESRGKQFAVSHAGCVGTMQVNPRFSKSPRWLLFSPTGSRHEGTRILCRWYRRSGNDIRLALAGYNGGNRGLRGEIPRALGYADRVLSRAGGRRCVGAGLSCGRKKRTRSSGKPR
ncbi:MAG TPA: hypothetical protein EYN66_06300 [Myxococcales bacterium]|nr:hypothetical protein [Myxococcales bacterium]